MLSLSCGKYKCIDKLGSGTYGQVFKVLSPKNEIFAVKRNIVSISYSGTAASVRELDILTKVQNHPYCLQLKETHFGTPFDNDHPIEINAMTVDKLHFVMEKGDLDGSRFIQSSPSWIDRKLFILHLLLAVEFLHSRKIYHRDIKPANVICFLENRTLKATKLTDFGLAQYYTFQNISSPDMVTLWYRAPEIVLHKEYDLKIDIWSLGCILYELLTGKPLFTPANEEQLINLCISTLPFPHEDYVIAKQIYKRSISSNYNNSQKNLVSLSNRINLPEYEKVIFNSSKVNGQFNSGKYDDCMDLLSHMLSVNPKNRYTATQCLNSEFFSGFHGIINQVRTQFGINSDGDWIFKPDYMFKYNRGNIRQVGMKWFKIVYNARNTYPINTWYNHRILFHAIEMFDRYLVHSGIDNVSEGHVLIWVNTFLFIATKFFRILQSMVSIMSFANGISEDQHDIFKSSAVRFEEFVIRDVFFGQIYQPTFYELAPEYLNDQLISKFLDLIWSEKIPSETYYREFWNKYNLETFSI